MELTYKSGANAAEAFGPPAPADASIASTLTKRKKFDQDGNYLEFPGITVVCDLEDEFKEIGASLRGCVLQQPNLGKIMLPLPPSSYHVTLLDCCCQYKLGLTDAEFAKFASAPQWGAAADLAASEPFKPRLEVERVTTWPGGIGIVMKPFVHVGSGPDEKTTPEHPAQVPLGEGMRHILQFPKPQSHEWHMTLAYCPNRAAYEDIAEEIREEERAFIEEFVKSQFSTAVGMKEARLCKFQSLLDFVPWDGRSKLLEDDEPSATLREQRIVRGGGSVDHVQDPHHAQFHLHDR